jgi:hypothetical protein
MMIRRPVANSNGTTDQASIIRRAGCAGSRLWHPAWAASLAACVPATALVTASSNCIEE